MEITRGRAVLAMAVLVLGSLGATACGDDEEPTAEGSEDAALPEVEDLTGSDEVLIDVPDNSFAPQSAAVDVGTEVTWRNIGRNEHNVTPSEDGSFEGVGTEDFEPGAEHSTTFDEPGIYGYYCTIHGTATAGQVGSITVVDPEAG